MSDTNTRLTGRVGNTSGTLLYMSPQQIAGDKPSSADDIYALGATLYELLTGKPPFYRGDGFSLMTQIRERAPAPLAAQRAELAAENDSPATLPPIPRAWDETILACLAKEPKDRPKSVGEVAARLGVGPPLSVEPGVRAGLSPRRPEVSPLGPLRRPTSKIPLLALATAALVLLAVGGWYLGVHRPEQQRLTAQQDRLVEEKRLADEKRAADERERQSAEKERAEALARQHVEEQARREALSWVTGLPLTASDNEIAAVADKIELYAKTAPSEHTVEVHAAFGKQRGLILAERERLRFDREKAAHPWTVIEAYLRDGKALLEIPFIVQSPSVQSLNKQINELQRNLQELAKRYLESHPKMVTAMNEYRKLVTARDGEARGVAEQQRVDYGIRFNNGITPAWVEPRAIMPDAFLAGFERTLRTNVSTLVESTVALPKTG